MKAYRGDIKGAVPLWVIVVPLVIVLAAYIAYQAVGMYIKALTKKVDCYELWKPTQLFGVEVNHTITVKDEVEKEPVSGINIYVFEEKPYYWKNLSYSPVASILSGKTPAATTDAKGKAVITFTTPESKTETKKLYLVLTGSGYWTDEYEMSVAFTPKAEAPSYEVCKDIYKTPYDFLVIKMTNAVTGTTVGPYTLYVKPIGTVNKLVGTLGVPTDVNKTFYEMKTSAQFVVANGYYRIDAIKIVPTGVFDPKAGVFEGIHRIEVEILKGNVKLLGPVVIFDEAIEESPLRKDGYWKVEKLAGKEIYELAPDEAITVRIKVVADTETVASAGSGRLGPGEQILKVQLIPAHPLTTPEEAVIKG